VTVTSGYPEAFAPEDFGIGRLFLHVRDAVVVANTRTEQIVLWNERAEAMFGYTEAEALELPLHALVPQNLREMHRTGIAGYQETGGGVLIDQGRPMELMALHKEGHKIPIELTLTKIPERTKDGDRFAMAIIRDITDRKRADDAAVREREVAQRWQQALKLNAEIVQGLSVVKLALEEGDQTNALDTVTETLRRAQAIIAQLLIDIADRNPTSPESNAT
jgi:PAS domain S-box-containing protein